MPSRHKLLAPLLFAVLISAFAVTLPAVTRAQNDDDLIRMTVTVWNRNGLIKGLTREAFQIKDDKTIRPIELFEDNDAPVSIGIVVDLSSRLGLGGFLGEAKRWGSEQVSLLTQRGNPDNEYFVLAFEKTPTFVTGWSTPQNLLSQTTGIRAAQGNDRTALWDACIAAIDKLQTAHLSRRAMILISNGHDDSSRHTFEEVQKRLRDADIVFYGIGFVAPRELVVMGLEKDKRHIFEEFADATGGAVFYPGNMESETAAFAQIAEELPKQYRLGFRRGQLDRPNQWRRIKLTITPPANAPREHKNLSFKTRQGYYTK